MPAERILVVDDDVAVLDVMVEVLRGDGYAPAFTSDTREAAQLLATGQFDLVISDIVMPHLTGLQLLELARRGNPDVQVVLVTAFSTREIALDALSKGASGLLEKPFSVDQFRATAHEALRRVHALRPPHG